MKLLLLGTAGYHPSDTRQTACLMLPEIGVVLDAGSGMYRVREHLVTPQLDIFVTHAHLDHVIGLTYLLDLLSLKRSPQIILHGLEENLVAIEKHLFCKALFPVKPSLEYRQLQQPVSLGYGGFLRYFPLIHPGGSVGFRLDWPNRSMAYVTDTIASPDAPYIDQIRHVDLLVHECYLSDQMSDQAHLTGHSWFSSVLQLAAAAEVGRLVLLHLHPLVPLEEQLVPAMAQDVFVETVVGHDRMVLDF